MAESPDRPEYFDLGSKYVQERLPYYVEKLAEFRGRERSNKLKRMAKAYATQGLSTEDTEAPAVAKRREEIVMTDKIAGLIEHKRGLLGKLADLEKAGKEGTAEYQRTLQQLIATTGHITTEQLTQTGAGEQAELAARAEGEFNLSAQFDTEQQRQDPDATTGPMGQANSSIQTKIQGVYNGMHNADGTEIPGRQNDMLTWFQGLNAPDAALALNQLNNSGNQSLVMDVANPNEIPPKVQQATKDLKKMKDARDAAAEAKKEHYRNAIGLQANAGVDPRLLNLILQYGAQAGIVIDTSNLDEKAQLAVNAAQATVADKGVGPTGTDTEGSEFSSKAAAQLANIKWIESIYGSDLPAEDVEDILSIIYADPKLNQIRDTMFKGYSIEEALHKYNTRGEKFKEQEQERTDFLHAENILADNVGYKPSFWEKTKARIYDATHRDFDERGEKLPPKARIFKHKKAVEERGVLGETDPADVPLIDPDETADMRRLETPGLIKKYPKDKKDDKKDNE